MESPEEAQKVLRRWQKETFFPTCKLLIRELDLILEDMDKEEVHAGSDKSVSEKSASDESDNETVDPDYVGRVGLALVALQKGARRKVI